MLLGYLQHLQFFHLFVLYFKHYRGLACDNYYFIIDGNHLLKASEELYIKPNLLAIVSFGPDRNQCDEIDNNVVKIITSFEEIRNTSYK